MKKIIPHTRTYDKAFTFGTLVTNLIEYNKMKQSFIKAGFTENDCEYLYIDNTIKNTMCAFQGLNEVLVQAKGRYVILLHQDVQAIDSRETLQIRFEELNKIDPHWALCGPAGGNVTGNFNLFLTDRNNNKVKVGIFPSKVTSLDEMFILCKNEARLSFSHDMTGFHYYGVDICTIADILGYNVYAIEYHTKHTGLGRKDFDFFVCQNRTIKKYKRALRDRYIQMTSNAIFLVGDNMKVINCEQTCIAKR